MSRRPGARTVVLVGSVVLLLVVVVVLVQVRRHRDGGSGAAQVQHLSVDGRARTFLVHVPAHDPAGPLPLVVMLHGGFGSGRQAERAYGWDGLADRHGFVVAYPDGLRRAWNTDGGCCGWPAREGVDDVAFIAAMVQRLRTELDIDPDRVYVTGISNGGIMSYTLACRTTLFAAIGPDAATELADCPGAKPASVIHVHGSADPLIRYDGGPGTGVARIDGPPVPDVVAEWRARDRCAPPETRSEDDLEISVARCPDGRAVELVTVEGGGHAWPEGTAARIWEFFAAHPRSSTSTG